MPEFAAILHTVTEYLTASLGSLPKDFSTDTLFIDADLDSLDLLKVPPFITFTWLSHATKHGMITLGSYLHQGVEILRHFSASAAG